MAVKFTATSDVNQVLADWDKLRAKNEQLVAKLQKVTKESGTVEQAQKKAMRELQRFADRTRDAVREPAEEMRRQLDRLGEAKSKDMLTTQEVNRATDQQIGKYVEATRAGGTFGQTLQRMSADQRAGKITADEYGRATEQLVRRMGDGGPAADQYRQQLETLRRQLDQGAISADEYSRKVGEVGEAFDSHNRELTEADAGMGKFAGAATMWVAKFATVATAVKLIGDAWRYNREQQDLAMQGMDSLYDANRRLAQVSELGGPLHMDRLEAMADEAAAAAGVDRTLARQVLFSAVSEGFVGDYQEIMRFADVIAPDAAATVAGQMPGLFRDDDMTPMEAINMAVAAAGESRLAFEQLAQAMPVLAEGAALTDTSPEEALATMSVMAGTFASGATAAAKFRALTARFSTDEGLAGRGIIGGVEALMALEEEERREFLGQNMQLNTAYQTLAARLPEVRERMGEIAGEQMAVRVGAPTLLEARLDALYSDTDRGRDRQSQRAQRVESTRLELIREQQDARAGYERLVRRDEVQRELREVEAPLPIRWMTEVSEDRWWMPFSRVGEQWVDAARQGQETAGMSRQERAQFRQLQRQQGLRRGEGLDWPQAAATTTDPQLLALIQRQTEATEAQTAALERVYEQTPRSGGSGRAARELVAVQSQGR